MKRRRIRFIEYCLTIVLIVVLATIAASCSTTPISTSVYAPPRPSTTALTLSSIVVIPATPDNLAVGKTQQFVAIGTNSDSSVVDITSQAIWSSSNINVAIISLAGSGGLATGLAVGNTNITATMYRITSPPVSLTVGTTASTTAPTTATTTTSVTPTTAP